MADPRRRRVEHQPRPYQPGMIVRDYTALFLGSEPNLATPINLSRLLEALEELTQALEEADAERRAIPGTEHSWPCIDSDTGEAFDQLCLDLTRWRARLDEYYMVAASVPDPQRYDQAAILWTVTAPLFLGFYGGRTGTEIALVPGGFPEGFDPTVPHGPDLATPFTIGNQLEVYREFEASQLERLIEDLEEAAAGALETGLTIAEALVIGFLIYGGVTLFKKAA